MLLYIYFRHYHLRVGGGVLWHAPTHAWDARERALRVYVPRHWGAAERTVKYWGATAPKVPPPVPTPMKIELDLSIKNVLVTHCKFRR